MKGDTPIDLLTIDKMDDTQIEDLLTGIRERRMRPIREYEEMLKLKEIARKEGLERVFEQQMGIMSKDLERLDKNIDKVEARARKLRALRMEIEG